MDCDASTRCSVEGDTTRGPADYKAWFDEEETARLLQRSADAEAFFRRTGITFNQDGDEDAAKRLIPFDIIRIISDREWTRLSKGIEQRVRAINAFLARHLPPPGDPRARPSRRASSRNQAFLPEMVGATPPANVYTHIVGVDIVTAEDEFFVLEDNARTPSGVSYMLENRETMLQMFPGLRAPEGAAGGGLPQALAPLPARPCAGGLRRPPRGGGAHARHPQLRRFSSTPSWRTRWCPARGGPRSAAHARGHAHHARLQLPFDVLYRRVDDAFLDPLTFRPDSVIGNSGIMDVYRAGRVTIANAPGTGIADDKAIYSYMPEIVQFYTGEQAILKNVPTWRLQPESLTYVIEHSWPASW